MKFPHPPPVPAMLSNLGRHTWLRWAIVGITLGCAFLPMLVPAQNGPPGRNRGGSPEELARLRELYNRRAETLSSDLDEEFETRLLNLENQLASEFRYEEAMVARSRRLAALGRLEERDADGSIEVSAGGTVYLPGVAGTMQGSVQRNEEGTAVGWWETAGSRVLWNVGSAPTGQYRVVLVYAAAESTANPSSFNDEMVPVGGEVAVGVIDSSNGEWGDKFSVQIKPTGSWGNYRTVEVGRLTVDQSPLQFAIEATAPELGGVMSLREARLIPTVPKPGADVPDPGRLTELRGFNNAHLVRTTAPIIQAYAESLAAHRADFIASGDTEAAEEIDREIERVETLAAEPGLLSTAGRDPALALSEEPDGLANTRRQGRGAMRQQPAGSEDRALAEFERIEEVRFVDHPDNTGSVFTATHEGRSFRLRLYFVACPPADEEADAVTRAESPELIGEYFGIDSDQAGILGREAAAFTAGYLDGRPFNVYTCWEEAPYGSYFAMVTLPSLGTLQKILVSRGLGAPTERGVDYDRFSGRSFLKQTLTKIELEAEREGRGAWSF